MSGTRKRSARMFAKLVWLFPSSYREGLGKELERVFRDQLDEAGGSRRAMVALWVRTLLKLPVSLVRAHLADLRGDARFAIRGMTRNPGFAAITVATLGLGIGAATSVFSVVNGVLLRPLPYDEPDRLVSVWAETDARPGDLLSLAAAEIQDLRARVSGLESVAGLWRGTITVTDVEPLQQVPYGWATHELPEVLGFEMHLGRWFAAEEESPDLKDVAVLSYAYWQRRFGGDPAVVGRTIGLGPNTTVIVGVLPEGFREVFDGEAGITPSIDIWVPQYLWRPNRNARWLSVIGRLAPGVSQISAAEELHTLAAALSEVHEEYATSNWNLVPVPLHDDVVGEVRSSIVILLIAVGLVLLIACSNVANLLLVRIANRQGEFAVRMEMGASNGRIVRQVLTENVFLAAAGGVLGVALSYLGVSVLELLRPANLPRLDDVRVDGVVLTAALALSLATGLLVGLVPALRASGTHLHEALKTAGRGVAGRRWSRVRGGLVLSQVAVALILLVGAGLMVRTFASLQRADVGFDHTNVLTIRVPLSFNAYPTNEEYAAFYLSLTDRVAQLPGITHAAGVSAPPLSGRGLRGPFAYDPETDAAFGALTADFRTATPGYFDAIGARLLSGRDFDPNDMGSGNRRVIIDETLANVAWPGGNPVGRRLTIPQLGSASFQTPQYAEVIGVVEHIRQSDVRVDGFPQVYLPVWDMRSADVSVIARTAGDPTELIPPLRSEIVSMGTGRAVHSPRTMGSFIREATADSTFALTLTAIFAILALVVASVGVYGSLSYEVARRKKEIGIRMALGAEKSSVLVMTLRRGLMLAAAGILLGSIGALGATRYVESLLFGVTAHDPLTYGAVAGIFLLVAAVACWVPAHRASRVDPVSVIE